MFAMPLEKRFSEKEWNVPISGSGVKSAANQLVSGATGSWMWTTS